MLIRSITPGSTAATAQATAWAAISAGEALAVLELEHLGVAQSPGIQSGGRITAPAKTGPARQPRPTSSTPATKR